MQGHEMTAKASRRGGSAAVLAAAGAALAIELLLVSLAYRHGFAFECRAMASPLFCATLSAGVPRALAMAGALGLIVAARPGMRRALTAGLRSAPSTPWAAVNLLGILCVLAPWTFLTDSASAAAFAAAAVLWIGGAALWAAGAAFFLLTPRAPLDAARAAGPALVAIAMAAAFLSPEAAAMAQHAWRWSPITDATFHASAWLLGLLGETVESEPAEVRLGVNGFVVLVGRQCSGIEGMVLISAFVGLFLHLFRDELRFPRAFVLLPLALAASWTLNVVRIVTLVWIGAHVSPELAVNGFHSHAGWLMFSALALTITLAAYATPWLRRGAPVAAAAARRAPPPLAQDWNAARLLPFVVFMATALLASTFFEIPELAYPLRFVATLATLALFHRLYRALDWRLDPVSLAAGLAVGAAWIATDPAAAEGDAALGAALAALPAWAFALWVATRTLGTSLVVPMVEELLFRDYLLRRANLGGALGLAFAVALSTALFAALHGRWLAAGLAGLVFAWLALRRGRVTDAVQGHAAANAAIAAWAILQGDWSVI